MRALFLINARSGANRKRDLQRVIRESWASSDFDIIPCERKEDLDGIIGSARQAGYDAVIAVGGDGTVHEIAARMVDTGLALGVVPTGSGNGFARHLGIPTRPERAIRALEGARRVSIDTALVNGQPFFGVMGLGFDAEVAHRFARYSQRGLQTYVRAAVEGLLNHRDESYEIEMDGERLNETAVVVAVANTSQYGNNAFIAPQASAMDGLLDLVIVRRVRPLRLPLMISRLFRRSFDRDADVIVRQARRLSIRRPEGPGHLDGEPVMLSGELEVVVKPASLVVLSAVEKL